MEFLKNLQVSGELKYYLRDLYIFLFSIFISIVLAETLIFSSFEKNDVVDKIFIYTYFIFPLFSLALVASYIYRSIRIRQTGKIRSIIRYRLTLGFIFVSILPSIPVFLLSSNVLGKMVESFYRIDISESLRSAISNIYLLEQEERRILFYKASELKKVAGEGKNFSLGRAIKKARELDISTQKNFFLGLLYKDKIYSENNSLFSSIRLEDFKKKENEMFDNLSIYNEASSFIFVRIFFTGTDYSVLLGKKIHLGNERNIYNIIQTEKLYNQTDLWKSKIPFSLRLSLGIFTILVFGTSILLSFVLARQISRPIVELAYATQRISKGETDVILELKEEGEMGILIDSFNQMTRDLKTKKEEILHIQRIAAWKEVAQRMAHEIKNPLTPIQLYAERIQKKLETAKSKEDYYQVVLEGTNTIIGQVKVLEHLVKEFSEFARMPAPILVNQSLNPIIEESVNLFKDTENIKIELKLFKNLPKVSVDKKLFLGVVNNLIKNAVEAIISAEDKEKSGIIRITTKLEKKYITRYITLYIEDNGPGVPIKLRDKIFEPYFSTKEKHGTGIGLSIVEKTVYDHRGRISIGDSSLGGCMFKIELPIAGS